jgi:hypothetical protein
MPGFLEALHEISLGFEIVFDHENAHDLSILIVAKLSNCDRPPSFTMHLQRFEGLGPPPMHKKPPPVLSGGGGTQPFAIFRAT